MKKILILFGLALMAGIVFQGCVWTDSPPIGTAEPRAANTYVNCLDCGIDDGHAWAEGVVGTAGPPGYFLPGEAGEYWDTNQNVLLGEEEETDCVPNFGSSAGGIDFVRLDSINNEAGDRAVGCPPAFLCGWLGSGAGVLTGFGQCPPPPGDDLYPQLCGLGNGPCVGPNLFGGARTLWPADTFISTTNYICLDATPGATNEFFDNIRRGPVDPCDNECSDLAAPAPAPVGKTLICHVPRGNPANEHTIEIGLPAVPAHIAHGDPEDSVGRGCGGPGGGEGLAIPDGINPATSPSLAIAWLVDLAQFFLTDGLPYVGEYGSGTFLGSALEAESARQIAEIYAGHDVDDQGMITLGISQLVGPAGATEMSPPLSLRIGIDVSEGFQFKWAVATDQTDQIESAIRFLLQNTEDGEALNLSQLRLALDNGQVINLGVLNGAMPFRLSLGHERLAMALDKFSTMSHTDTTTIERIQYNR